jgi:hypothetical protein
MRLIRCGGRLGSMHRLAVQHPRPKTGIPRCGRDSRNVAATLAQPTRCCGKSGTKYNSWMYGYTGWLVTVSLRLVCFCHRLVVAWGSAPMPPPCLFHKNEQQHKYKVHT